MASHSVKGSGAQGSSAPKPAGTSSTGPSPASKGPAAARAAAARGPVSTAAPTAKEAAVLKKATQQAERARKKSSTDPADMGRLKQIYRAYQLTHEFDKQLPYLLLAAFIVPIIVFWALHFAWDHPIYLTIVGIMFGLLLAMIVLVQRAKKATFKRYAGQAGSAEVALQMLPKQWVSSPVIAVTRQQDAVHRTVGPGGLVLIGEGEPGRLKALLSGEVKKHQRVAYGIPVTTIVMGEKEGQVPLSRLAEHIKKLPKTLQPNQITDIKQRLRALDAVRPPMPVPRGPMPTSARQAKGSRQAMRGR